MDDRLLGPLERRVMASLWSAGSQSVGQILTALNETSSRKLAYTTVLTVLVRLHGKGYVDRTGQGRQYIYRAAMSEDELIASIGRRELGELIARFGAASLAEFAADLGSANQDLIEGLRDLAREHQ